MHLLQAGGDSGTYQSSDFAAAFTSQPKEYEYWITEIEGQVPESLRGTLFRNGPGRLATHPFHWLHHDNTTPAFNCATQPKAAEEQLCSD